MKTLRTYLSTLLIAALVITSLPVAAAPASPQSMDLVSTGPRRCARSAVKTGC